MHLVPAALCALGGLICAQEAAFNMRLGENTTAVRAGLSTVVCWVAAAVSLWGAVS
jgi:hypothetical protein